MYINDKHISTKKILTMATISLLLFSAATFLILNINKGKLTVNTTGGDEKSKVTIKVSQLGELDKTKSYEKIKKGKGKKIKIKAGKIMVEVSDGNRAEITTTNIKKYKNTNLDVLLKSKKRGLKLTESDGAMNCMLSTKPLPKTFSCLNGKDIASHDEIFGDVKEKNEGSVLDLETLVDRTPYQSGLLDFVSQEQGLEKDKALRYWNPSSQKSTYIPITNDIMSSLKDDIRAVKIITSFSSSDKFGLKIGNAVYVFNNINDTSPKKIAFKSTESGAQKLGLVAIGDESVAGYFGTVGTIIYDDVGSLPPPVDPAIYITDLDSGITKRQFINTRILPFDIDILNDQLLVSGEKGFFAYEMTDKRLNLVFSMKDLLSLASHGGDAYGFKDASVYKYSPDSKSVSLVYRSGVRLSNINSSGGKLYFSGFYGSGSEQKLYGFSLTDEGFDRDRFTKIISLKRSSGATTLNTRVQNGVIRTTLPLKSLRSSNGRLVYNQEEWSKERNAFIGELKKIGVDHSDYKFEFNLVTKF